MDINMKIGDKILLLEDVKGKDYAYCKNTICKILNITQKNGFVLYKISGKVEDLKTRKRDTIYSMLDYDNVNAIWIKDRQAVPYNKQTKVLFGNK